jgi:hypothetical protein
MIRNALVILLVLSVGIYAGHYLTVSFDEWLAANTVSDVVEIPKEAMSAVEEQYKRMAFALRELTEENKHLQYKLKEMQQNLI